MIIIHVHLHTALRNHPLADEKGVVRLSAPDGAVIENVLEQLGITLKQDSLILVINHCIADVRDALHDGDQLDIIPAISGG